ncbi:MAG: MBL fold metallo-hydrolase [Candidatus Thiodiazotropha sp.]|jgi:hydroxyacylglutathione hydrolase
MNISNSSKIVKCRVTNGTQINYCYLVINLSTRSCVAIDPAWERHTIEENLLHYQVNLSGILITHHHRDHIDLASTLAKSHNCKIYLSSTEYRYYNMKLEPSVLLKDRVAVTLGGMTILPIVTPGHTAGSTCYLINNALFTGDTLFNEGTGVCFTEGGDPIQMFHSVQTLKQLISDSAIIYPGHRYKLDLGMQFSKVKRYNIYLQFKDIDQFVKFRMRGNKRLYNYT